MSPAKQELYDDEVKLRDLGFDKSAITDALAYLKLADQYVGTQGDEAVLLTFDNIVAERAQKAGAA